MGFIAAIPGLIALFIALQRSPARAFLDVYIPVVLLFPEYYRWVLPALPDPTFSQSAILPIAVIYLLKEGGKWQVSLMDFLIVGFAICVGVSQYTNAGFGEAQNLMFDMIGSIVLPYVAAKGLIEPKGLRVQFARRFVILLFAICILSLYEFKMGSTPWRLLLGRFFPGQGDGWITTFRYGFARVAGPYGHAILAGLILIVGFRVQRWLEWSGHWESRFRLLPSLNFSKARVITFGLVAGILMTLVRGPWLGGFAGALFTAAGLPRNRKRALLGVGAVIIAVGIPATYAFYSYASVGRAAAKSDSQETAAYRFELVTKYFDIAMQKRALGWGLTTWPKVSGMPSIDNYYLLLALMHGFIADGFLITMILVMIFRLIRHDMKLPPPQRRGSSLGFTLAGIYVAIGVTIATVFLGTNAVPVFAVITGWSEGYLLSRPDSLTATQSLQSRTPRPFAFRRVIA